MLRRAFTTPVLARPAATCSATTKLTQATRSYFSPGAGETGIWAETLKRTLSAFYWLGWFWMPLFLYKVVYRRNCPDKQWVCQSTDKWYSDGTEMKGDEATANLRLQRERIMPIMDAYLEKIEKSNLGHAAHPVADSHGHAAHH